MDHHPHDEKFIIEQLNLIKPSWRDKAKRLYKEKFIFTFKESADKVNQENQARVAANTLLREIVEKCNKKVTK